MSIFIASSPNDISTQAKYAQFGQMFGQALSGFGWLPQTGHGEIANNGLTGTSYAWSGTPVVGSTVVQPCTYTFKGAWVSGNTYTGIGSTINNTGVNVVTSGGLTYVHITATSSSATAPASDTTNWAPFNFEIWKNNDAYSSTFPIYLKLAYVQNATTNVPAFLVAIGTGVDADGNLTGTAPLWATSPLSFFRANPTTALDGSNYNHYFSGDAGNFRFCIFKDRGQSTSSPTVNACQILVIDRACTAVTTNANRDDSFVYICHALAPGGTNVYASVIIPNPGISTQALAFDNARWSGMTCASLNAAGGCGGGLTPLLITPFFGQRPNPQLGACGFIKPEVQDGYIIPVWMYGQPHLFLACGLNTNTGGPTQITSASIPAILWE